MTHIIVEPTAASIAPSVTDRPMEPASSHTRVPVTPALQEQVAQDQTVMRAIAERWHTALTTGDIHTRELLFAALEDSISNFAILLQSPV